VCHPRGHATPYSANNKDRMVTRVKRITIISIIAALAVIAIVVPITVVFVRKRNMKLDPFVLVPLYIYPNLGAWDPLYEAYVSRVTDPHPRNQTFSTNQRKQCLGEPRYRLHSDCQSSERSRQLAVSKQPLRLRNPESNRLPQCKNDRIRPHDLCDKGHQRSSQGYSDILWLVKLHKFAQQSKQPEEHRSQRNLLRRVTPQLHARGHPVLENHQ